MGVHRDFQHFFIFAVVALFLIVRAHKCANHANARELFTEHLVEHIHLGLLFFEPGMGLFRGHHHHHRNHRYHKQQNRRQLYVLPEAHDNAAQQQNGRCNDRPQQHLHHLLNLVDVVCSSGNQ